MNFITFGVASSISTPAPVFRMVRVRERSSWNHISDFHAVLKTV